MKDKFIQSTIILLIGGLITKVLGMLIKIIMARLIGTEGLGYYMLILPTFILLINISQLGLPLALSKLISEDKKSSKKLFLSILPILIIINIIIMILIYILSPIISNNLLHNKDLELSIKAMSLVIPFTSISSICRSYFFGKQRMFPHVLSNIIEDLVRIIIMIIGVSHILPYGLKYTICFIILSNIISESISTIILLIFLPKNITIKKKDLYPNKSYMKESLKIGLPTTTSRIISNIAYFLEPIILTTSLIHTGYSSSFITREYGIISGYVLPLILLPSFFTLAISQALLPVISKDYVNGNYKTIKKKLITAITLSLLIVIPITIFLLIKPSILLTLIYHTNEGISYIKVLAPICILEYIQAPLTTCLDAIGKSKDNLTSSIIGMTSRTILLIILTRFQIGLWSLIISISTNIILTTLYEIKKVRTYLT